MYKGDMEKNSRLADIIMKKTPVIWLTGISGSGKSTLGLRLTEHFRRCGAPVEFLDGDVVRAFFENDLGYSRRERLLNIRRITFAAKLLSDHGITVIVANIAPYFEARAFIRRKLSNYIQVYCAATLDRVVRSDVKGLYGKGDAEGPLIGVDDVYDIPRSPDLILHTDTETEEESFLKLKRFLEERGVV